MPTEDLIPLVGVALVAAIVMIIIVLIARMPI